MSATIASHTPLPGTLWGIATFFNPAGYANKYENFRTFREASKRQGLSLLVVEAAMGDKPFELQEDDADRVIHVRTAAVLWQKERLYNVALSHLPPECDKVVWLDTDVVLENDDWVAGVSDALTRSLIVQPFTRAAQLPRGVRGPADIPKGNDIDMRPSTIGWWIAAGKPRNGLLEGHTGYAIAARRSFLDRYGFYDWGIAGSGDAIMMGAFLDIDPHDNSYLYLDHCPLLEHATDWSRSVAAAVHGSVGVVEGAAYHLWHGARSNRFYAERGALLIDFDPFTDIRIDDRGCWAWATDKPQLHARVRSYFWMRDEESEETSLMHLCIATLEEQMVHANYRTETAQRELAETAREYAACKAESAREYARLQAENAVLRATLPGPILLRCCRLLDRVSYVLFPKKSTLRRSVRAVLFRLLRITNA